MKKVFLIFPLLAISIVFCTPCKVKAATYSCGPGSSNLHFCCKGGGAISAVRCDPTTEIEVPKMKACCPIDTEPINDAGIPKCCYDGLEVANGTAFYRGLCCPPGWVGEEDSERTCYKLGGDSDEWCRNQADCDKKAEELGWEHDSLVQEEARDAPNRNKCPASDQCYKYTQVTQGIDNSLCYYEYTLITDSPLIGPNKGQYCKNGSFIDAPEGCICDEDDCEEGVEDNPSDPNYCPADCRGSSSSDPANNNASPPPEISCKDLCSGEGTFVDSDNDPDTPSVFVSGDQYANCCMCVCGTSDCPDDLDASRDVFTSDVWTELGCISASQEGIVISIMRIFVGAVLGIGLLRFIQAAFMLNTDDPEKIKEGKSIFFSAIMAIVLGVMMPILINFLGLDILGIGELFSF